MRFIALYIFLLLPFLLNAQSRCFRTANKYLSFVNEPPTVGFIKYNKFIDYESLIEIRNAEGNFLSFTDGLKFYDKDLKPIDSIGSVPFGDMNTKWWTQDEKEFTLLSMAEPNRSLMLVNIPLLNGQLDFKNKSHQYLPFQTPIFGRVSVRFIENQVLVAHFKRDTLVLTQLERNGNLVQREEIVFKEFTPYSDLTSSIVENIHFSYDAKTLLVETMRFFDPDSSHQQLFALNIENLQVTQLDSLYSHGFINYFDTVQGIISKREYLFNSLAFSPNDSLIYAIRANSVDFIPDLIQLERFPDKNGKRKRYENKFNVNGTAFAGGRLFQGSNRKMYIPQIDGRGRQFYMGRIEHPDSFGKAARIICTYIPFEPNGMLEDLDYPFRQFAQFTAQLKTHEWQFQNISDADYVRFQWYWGDGDSLYSNSKTLTHRFRSPGLHLVKLKAFTPKGYYVWYSDSIEAKSRIRLSASTESQRACQWQQVSFRPEVITQVADPDTEAYLWDFGDGTTGTKVQPSHVYPTPGTYSWSLRYTNGYDTATYTCNACLTVQAAPKAQLALEQDSLCVPDILGVKDLSTGSIGHRAYYLGTSLLGSSLPTPALRDTGKQYLILVLNPDSSCSPTDSLPVWGLAKADAPINLRQLEVLPTGHVRLSALHLPIDSLLIEALTYQMATVDSHYTDTKAKANEASVSYVLAEQDQCGNRSATKAYNTAHVSAHTSNGIDISVSATLPNYLPAIRGSLRVLSPSGQLLHKQALTQSSTDIAYKLPSGYAEDSIFFQTRYHHKKDSTTWISNRAALFTDAPKIWLPNAFSPNRDGTNDAFKVVGYKLDTMEVRIFDRWGALVFYSNEQNPEWDGRKGNEALPLGSYFCIVSGSFGDEQLQTSGMLLLMR